MQNLLSLIYLIVCCCRSVRFITATILEDVSVTETIAWCKTIDLKTIIFQCSKNYDSPTRETKLKKELNMADSISLNENRP